MWTCRARSAPSATWSIEGVNAIIINPNSPTAFDPIFAQAKQAASILVIATDAEVSRPTPSMSASTRPITAAKGCALARRDARRQGQCRRHQRPRRPSGQRDARRRLPGRIRRRARTSRSSTETNANWDQAQGQQTMQTPARHLPADRRRLRAGRHGRRRLARHRRRQHDRPTSPRRARSARTSSICESAGKYNSAASVNPPGVMASALNVAVLRLQGKEFKDGIFGWRLWQRRSSSTSRSSTTRTLPMPSRPPMASPAIGR